MRLEKGETILVKGPASIRVLDGIVRALNVELPSRGRVVVREDRVLPIKALEDSLIEVLSASDGSIERIKEEAFPDEWFKVLEFLSDLNSVDVAIFGASDVGKSTFTVMVANEALKNNVKPVAVVDGDLGQTDVGPPGTVSYTLLSEPVVDLFQSRFEEAFFLGCLSPSCVIDELIEAMVKLKKSVESKAEAVVVNTDGWMSEEALPYKTKLLEELKPRVTVLIGEEELLVLKRKAEEVGSKFFFIPPPRYVRKRSVAERRGKRERNYRKYFMNPIVRKLPISWVKFVDAFIGSGTPLPSEKLRKLSEHLGLKCIYGEHTGDRLYIVVKGGGDSWTETTCMDVKTHIIPYSLLKGLLVGLHDPTGAFKGLAVLKSLDGYRRTIEFLTSYDGPIGYVKLGYVKLDEQLREIAKFRSKPIP